MTAENGAMDMGQRSRAGCCVPCHSYAQQRSLCCGPPPVWPCICRGAASRRRPPPLSAVCACGVDLAPQGRCVAGAAPLHTATLRLRACATATNIFRAASATPVGVKIQRAQTQEVLQWDDRT
eukprot:361002-Chlamydomonas_euryale.AAC.2